MLYHNLFVCTPSHLKTVMAKQCQVIFTVMVLD
uniref:Uncharacterized protein n=1 Tax=Arundo donax TaxID=35708 RepID=A0A0A9A725_ARUDO